MERFKTVLLFGGSGQLGTEMRRRWTARFISPSQEELDITDAAAVESLIEASKPDLLVNCAAFHNVDRCESEPEQAFSANALAVNAMAEQCIRHNVRFVTFSTDYVFDGTRGAAYRETDCPNPLSAYGCSKLAGELLVRRLQSDAIIIRTCGLYGLHASVTKGYTFIDRIIAQARAGEQIRVVNDQTVSPTYAAHLAQAVEALLNSDPQPGIYHAVNEGAVTWYDYARETLRVAGIDHPIEPVSHTTWPSRVRRPAFSALENARLHELRIAMPSWQQGVADYIRDRDVTRP
ncbi:MAG TPA: dTDP-4-dehydrorhamnose reductase [Candidatus Baltobacteraceae bacterium]|nr:dTDP-4-dehydrorhamnose reductase [Candidatus Baltobacteraceae bacterium]